MFPDDFNDSDIQRALVTAHPKPQSDNGYLSRVWNAAQAQPGIIKDTAIGVGKGMAQTGYNLADIVHRGTSFGVGLPPNPINTQPTNVPQTIGKAAEQVGEYFIPGGAITRGANAVKAATTGVRGAGLLTGLTRAGLEGVSAAGVNYAQNEDPQAALKAGETAGVVSGGMQALGSFIPSAQRLYLSALKPKKPLGIQSPQKVLEAQKTVAQTGLREGVPVSEYGLRKAEEITDQLNREIAQKVSDKSAQLGPVIKPESVASRIDQVQPQFQAQVNPEADVAALRGSKAEYLRKHTPEPEPTPTLYGPDNNPLPAPPPPKPTPMTLSEAQSEKQATYTQMRKKYGELGSAETEGQKALARGLKEEILSRAPELQKLNARDSSMIELENQLANFVKRTNNRDLLDLKSAFLGSALAGAGGAGEGYKTGGWGGAAKHGAIGALLGAAMGNPAVKSSLAIALGRAGGAGQAAVSAAPKIAAAAPQLPKMEYGDVVEPGDGVDPAPVIRPSSVRKEPASIVREPEPDAKHVAQHFARKGGIDHIMSGNVPHMRKTATTLRQHNPRASMHVNGSLSPDPKESRESAAGRVLPHIRRAYRMYLQNPKHRIAVVTHQAPVGMVDSWVKRGMPADNSIDPADALERRGIFRLAPGKRGKPELIPVDLSADGKLRPGVFLIAHGDGELELISPQQVASLIPGIPKNVGYQLA